MFSRFDRKEVESQPNDVMNTASTEPPGRRLVVRWPGLVVMLGLLLVAAIVLTESLGVLPNEWRTGWPWAVLVVGGLMLLGGLLAGWSTGALVGPLLVAGGVVGVLARQGVEANTLLLGGALMIAAGTGIVLRGLTMIRP
ncbi:MAG: hypothetical protein Kow0077_07190 [Anaerolineae bacterium]